MNPYEIKPITKELFPQRVHVQQRIGSAVLQTIKFETMQDSVRGELVATLTAHVLTDRGGVPVKATKVIDRKVKPRWLPRWLWDRIYVEHVAVDVVVEPLWSYPSADIAVPELGRPVRMYVPPWPDVRVKNGW